MSAHPSSTNDPGSQATDTHAHSHALNALIGMGTNLARLLHDAAVASTQPPKPQPAQPHPEAPSPALLIPLAAAFDRVSRAVRRCIALARHLAKPVPPAKDPAQHRTTARKRILREVEDTIHRAAHEGGHAEDLNAELRERLDAPDLEDDLATRPVAEIIAEIRRDLGLAAPPGDPAWKRRTPADIADLNARAAAPSRPQHHVPGPGGPADAAAPPAPAPRPVPTPASTLPPQAPSHAGGTPPGQWDDPAGLIATILRHPAPDRDRWRPPPGA